MNRQEIITQLIQFRQGLYESFPKRADALIDLLDALSSNTTARSVVELSLNPLFRRCYSSLHDSIDNFFQATSYNRAAGERLKQEQAFMSLIAAQLHRPKERSFWLFGIDVTPAPRPFARSLRDRTFVHQPNTIFGNKPIAIGHQYSALVAFPEKKIDKTPPWVTPLSVRRVASKETATSVGVGQIKMLLEDKKLPFHNDLCVQVVDSSYSAVAFLGRVAGYDNLITIARLRGNRTLYRTPTQANNQQGHPTWYGERFDLKDPSTWGKPDEVLRMTHTTRRGCTHYLHLEGWHNLLMRGKRDLPMHQHPFTLIRIRVRDADGKPLFKRPLWLIVVGARRHQLSLEDAWKAYGQRYDIDHFFRFGKGRLLMDAYQTPEVEHEENWWQIASLSYVQLWLAHPLAEAMPRTWESYLPQPKKGLASPSTVQRDFGRIIRQIGTPAVRPKRRGKSPGRNKGERPERRKRFKVIKKGSKKPRRALRAA